MITPRAEKAASKNRRSTAAERSDVPESNSRLRRKAIQKGACPQCAVLTAEVTALKTHLAKAHGAGAAGKRTTPTRSEPTPTRPLTTCGGRGRCQRLGCEHA